MATIQVLDQHVAELIAAGEVCERPSSVIKELVENAIDAGASIITVEIKNGGITYMRVTDNGCGIDSQSVPTAFLRHATSKISTEEDLDHILTLGFRGEALASVAAVSKTEMMTKTADELAGTSIIIEGSEIVEIEEIGCPTGTTIVVKDLFYNTPARMKFLKKDVAEANAVCGVVEKIALSHPDIAFQVIRDQKEYLSTPGDGKLLSAIHSVLGKNVAKGMIPVDFCLDEVKVSGFVSKPEHSRANRTLQNFFVNGRFVKSRTCAAALEQAYKHAMMVQKFPVCVLMVSLSPQLVDVNVHPAKIEVRFVREKAVFDAVFHGVKDALSTHNDYEPIELKHKQIPIDFAVPEIETEQQISLQDFRRTIKKQDDLPETKRTALKQPQTDTIQFDEETDMLRNAAVSFQPTVSGKLSSISGNPSDALKLKTQEPTAMKQFSEFLLQKSTFSAPNQETLKKINSMQSQSRTDASPFMMQAETIKPVEHLAKAEESPFRIVGEIFDTYICIEQGQDLILLDKHAAHERAIFNRLKETQNDTHHQLLLEAITVTLSLEDYHALLENLDTVRRLGFDLDDFGTKTFVVRSLPMYLSSEDVQPLFEELAQKLSNGIQDLTPAKLDDLYHSVACRAAIKAHDKSSPMEREKLVSQILHSKEIRYCPHGRPVAIVLTKNEIEKRFGRQ